MPVNMPPTLTPIPCLYQPMSDLIDISRGIYYDFGMVLIKTPYTSAIPAGPLGSCMKCKQDIIPPSSGRS